MGDKDIPRRFALKTIAAGTLGSAGVRFSSENVSARDTIEEGDSIGNRGSVESADAGTTYHLEMGHGVEYIAELSNSDNTIVEHKIGYNSIAVNSKTISDDNWELTGSTESVSGQTMKIGTENANTYLYVGQQDNLMYGAKPASDDSLSSDDLNAAKGIIQTALGEMHPAYTLGVTVAQIQELLTDDPGDTSSDDSELYESTWNYGPTAQPSVPSQYAEFNVGPHDNCEPVQFYVTGSFGSYSAGRIGIKGTYRIDSVEDCGNLTQTQDVNLEENSQYTKLSENEVDSMNISLEKFDGGPIYKSTNNKSVKLIDLEINTEPADN
ncbi:hypothetical protein [Halolamina salifodinae]|uniref:Uncharacterized protein n=1 Tax=Halolamina salifodinae TaxID=1202767 RepID=A0A8T4H228_9EURY|nr:hypothetical protein [Halolamina salifodinae]MBP1987675.1 hypothetical protein [Halolamina salifodinae]